MKKNKKYYHKKCLVVNIAFLAILFFGSYCAGQRKDFIINDDELRLIINKRLDKKYSIDKKEYNRILISSKILKANYNNPIILWEKGQRDILSSNDTINIDPAPIDYTPTLESNYFVYELDRLPHQNLVFELSVKFADDEIHGAYVCDFEIELN
jgi:hypothetical protein